MDTNDQIDQLEALLENCVPVNNSVKHHFWGGFYIRQIFMPEGTDGKENIVTSMIHNTRHPYFVSKGKVRVYNENDGYQEITAPYWGETLPNTRRVLHIIEDTEWTTFHRTDIVPENDSKEAIEEAATQVGLEILMPHENKYLNGHYVNNNFIPNKEINY